MAMLFRNAARLPLSFADVGIDFNGPHPAVSVRPYVSNEAFSISKLISVRRTSSLKNKVLPWCGRSRDDGEMRTEQSSERLGSSDVTFFLDFGSIGTRRACLGWRALLRNERRRNEPACQPASELTHIKLKGRKQLVEPRKLITNDGVSILQKLSVQCRSDARTARRACPFCPSVGRSVRLFDVPSSVHRSVDASSIWPSLRRRSLVRQGELDGQTSRGLPACRPNPLCIEDVVVVRW